MFFFLLLVHGPGLKFNFCPFSFIEIICFTFSFQDHLLCWWFFWKFYMWHEVFENGIFFFGWPNCSLDWCLFYFSSCVLLCTWKSEERKTPLSISTNESKTDLIETLWKMHHDTRNFCKICVFTSNIFHNSNLVKYIPPPKKKIKTT